MLKKQAWYTIMKNYSALSEQNRVQITELSKATFGEKDALFIDEFIRETPFMEDNKVFLACDDKTDKIIGFVNLTDIPLHYHGVEMKSGELSIVATDPNYRNLGISSKLTELFMEEVRKCGYTSLFIQGIPHFYRKYGFNYAIPMTTSTFNFKSSEKQNISDCTLRAATVEDVDYIYSTSKLYSSEHDGVCRVIRPEIIHQSITTYTSPFLKRYYFILEKEGEKQGYFYYTKEHENPKIEEISEMGKDAYTTILNEMKSLCVEQFLLISIPFEHSFYSFLKETDESFEIDRGDYAWQVKIPDYFLFFQQIKPVLEQNLKRSSFKDQTISFKFNNFQDLITFEIKASKIILERLPWELTWDCNIPPQAFVKIAFDDFDYDYLKPILPDLMIKDELRDIFKVMFPSGKNHLGQGY